MYSNKKIFLIVIISFVLVLSMISPICSCGATSRYPAKHIYLFFTDNRIRQLKKQIEQDSVIRKAWQVVLSKANKALDQKNPSNELEALCLAYRMTDNSQYAAKVKDIILTICQQKQWEGPEMLERNPPWHAGLDAAAKSYSTAFGFDCIYNYLSPEDRKAIADSIVEKGIKPLLGDWIWGSSRIHSLNSMGHNWWSSSVSMAGVASLAVMQEIPQAKEWTETIAKALLQWFDFSGDVLINKTRTFGSNGGYYESIGYADFAMKEYLLFRLAWMNRYDSKLFNVPVLGKIGDFFINSSYPNSKTSMMVNFGDSHVDNNDWYPILLLMANGYMKDRYLWFLDNLQQGLPTDKRYYDDALGLVYNVEKFKNQTPDKPDLPPSAWYPDIGWGMLRSSWKNDATFLAVKSGDTWNHAHADANSFILFYHGQNLLTDGGTTWYASPSYSNYFFQSKAHNVVLFDGEGQRQQDEYFGVKNQGRLYHMMDGGFIKYIFGDATGPTSQNFDRNYRHFLWIGNVILIIDDLKANRFGKMEWLLHFGGAKAIQDGLDIRISKDNAHIFVRPLFPETLCNTGFPHDFPEKMILETKDGIKDHTSDTEQKYFAIAVPGKIKQTKWVTAIILPDSTDTGLPTIKKIQSKDMIGVKITQGNLVTNVYLNILADGRMMGRNSNNTFDGWETDAYLTAITYPIGKKNDPENALSYFIANGSYLRKNGQVVLNSLSKVNMISERTGNNMKVWLQGQPLVEASWYCGKRPDEVWLNNQQVHPAYNNRTKQLTLVLADLTHQQEAKQLEK